MGILSKATALVFLAIIATPAFALVEGPSFIRVGENVQEIPFYAKNDSATEKYLEAEFTIPSKHEIASKPEWIGANSKGEVKVRIYPEERLEDTTYTGKAMFNLGGDISEKIISIEYAKEDSCPSVVGSTFTERPGADAAKAGGSKGAEPSKFIFTVKNSSYKPKVLKLLAIEGAPQDWKISGAGTRGTYSIGAFETRKFEAAIEGQSAFTGEASFRFGCSGKEIVQKQQIKAGNVQGDGAGAGSGILSGFAVFASSIHPADVEFILDAFLAIIAAVLLIAFIARLVNFANRNRGR